MSVLRIALAQINTTVGDLAGNEHKIAKHIQLAHKMGVDVIAFPELAVPGYPPEDLLLKPSFVRANRAALERIARATQTPAGRPPGTAGRTPITAVVGFVDHGDDIYNAAAVLHEGRVAAVYHKTYLPNYGVFDEERYFGRGAQPLVLTRGGLSPAGQGRARIGINICEDIWYPAGPTKTQALAGAQLVINISASPYHAGKQAARERMLATRAADNVVFVAFCNLVGGQDELVFDGGSVILDERGEVVARAKSFTEDLLVADLDLTAVFRQQLHDPRRRQERARIRADVLYPADVLHPADTLHPADEIHPGDSFDLAQVVQHVTLDAQEKTERPAVHAQVTPLLPARAEVYQALVLGVRDYVRKNGFRQVVIGLSGGIDSALTAAIAADALGAENVSGVFMPSRYSSNDSREDATQLAEYLGISFLTVPIDDTFQAYLDMLAGPFAGQEPNVAEENIQARIRGNILMALSNKFGWLVLTTGNKSEMSVGYATLYGDMAGGFAVIKDVPKDLVYKLAAHVNECAGRAVIPQRTIDKAPTAELRPNQTDQDTLPPYPILDGILHAYVEEDRSVDEIVALGFERATVVEVTRMVDRSEYKRRQAPPGVKITPRAFGKDRRLPITNWYREE